ncbi:hypothetical protein DKM44_01820 [Deinococcus irradiatisoli]|uniref:Aminoglycoside phosphotransferase domain-containing protein n=1 Tax=Deinococcus irradiatisoli TaxID=2202254 RepID=A0A2Z3JF72_9DEIO|nr:aminoglycoside phosphotransferase family protein [Deinococcus irradiatisoli]AWN22131.1 hypothetical protein DKM44_01820 [Deinococcus irradiatisoli]
MTLPILPILQALFPGQTVVARRAPGASSTPTWRVGLDEGEVAVKLYRDQGPAEGQAALLGVLRAQGVLVPRTQWRRTGDTFALITDWVPGETLASALEHHPEQAGLLGLALGKAHATLHGVALQQKALDWIPKLAAMTGLAGTQVLHLDYHPLNVLIESGEVTAILDWENVRLGDARADVARTLSILSVDPAVLALPAGMHAPLRAFRRGYLKGYAGVGGSVSTLAPALAWAGQFLLDDLASRYSPDALATARRWTASWHWRARARR